MQEPNAFVELLPEGSSVETTPVQVALVFCSSIASPSISVASCFKDTGVPFVQICNALTKKMFLANPRQE